MSGNNYEVPKNFDENQTDDYLNNELDKDKDNETNNNENVALYFDEIDRLFSDLLLTEENKRINNIKNMPITIFSSEKEKEQYKKEQNTLDAIIDINEKKKTVLETNLQIIRNSQLSKISVQPPEKPKKNWGDTIKAFFGNKQDSTSNSGKLYPPTYLQNLQKKGGKKSRKNTRKKSHKRTKSMRKKR